MAARWLKKYDKIILWNTNNMVRKWPNIAGKMGGKVLPSSFSSCVSSLSWLGGRQNSATFFLLKQIKSMIYIQLCLLI